MKKVTKKEIHLNGYLKVYVKCPVLALRERIRHKEGQTTLSHEIKAIEKK